jgi:hypothetical protein
VGRVTPTIVLEPFTVRSRTHADAMAERSSTW